MLPGVYSVIVPLASVVVVVVVVSETCPHANGASHANAMLNTAFFIFSPLLVHCGGNHRSMYPLMGESKGLPLYPDSDWVFAVDAWQRVLLWSELIVNK